MRPDRRRFIQQSASVLGAAGIPSWARAQADKPQPGAKRLIFVVLNGGLSQIDSFDPKPALKQHAGKRLDALVKGASPGVILPSPWQARARGKSGIQVTDLFPALGDLIDKFWILRGLNTPNCTHDAALRVLLTGHAEPGRPTIGAWLAHKMGTPSDCKLPPFVALSERTVAPGADLWTGGFLPVTASGGFLDLATPKLWQTRSDRPAVDDRTRDDLRLAHSRKLLDTTGLDLAARADKEAREARLRAFATQKWQPGARGGAFDYGSSPFAHGCRLACDLVGQGVRAVQLFCGVDADGRSPFDLHGGSQTFEAHARMADRALGALVRDLESRGLLAETLLVIATEFGRSPVGVHTATAGFIRDHNPQGFSVLMAGSGLAGGHVHGTTDELGLRAVQDVLSPPDLLANILTRFRLNPHEVTFRHRSRIFSPVDPGCHLVKNLRLG